MAFDILTSYRERYKRLCEVEQQKNLLIEDLFHTVEMLSQKFEQEKLDHVREVKFNRTVQHREIALQREIRNYQAIMNQDPFVLVLLDGDGMIFNDTLLAQGWKGGQEAANLLWTAVRDDVVARYTDAGFSFKIVVRVYGNLRALGYVCREAGIIEHVSTLDEFARGFTGSKQLFDFVNVPAGKDRADGKLNEIFKLHIYDTHCRHIYFGGSHDNSYARLLEDYTESQAMSTVTLVEGTPFSRELKALTQKYSTKKFGSLFRDEKIKIKGNGANSSYSPPQIYETPTSTTPEPRDRFGSDTFAGSSMLSRGSQTSSEAESSRNGTPSWTTVAASKSDGVTSFDIQSTGDARSASIPRNKHGHRIDRAMKYDPKELHRIKKLKLCNLYFLKNECPNDDKCSHEHNFKPSAAEINLLKVLSRYIQCRKGGDCDDPHCVYGHICPVERDSIDRCHFGSTCWFDDSAHGVDKKIVDTIVVGGR